MTIDPYLIYTQSTTSVYPPLLLDLEGKVETSTPEGSSWLTQAYESVAHVSRKIKNSIWGAAGIVKDKVAQIWDKAEKVSYIGSGFKYMRENGKKPIVLSGLWGLAIATNAIDQNGTPTAVAAEIAASSTKKLFKKVSFLGKAAFIGFGALAAYGAETLCKSTPGLQNVSFLSMDILLGMMLLKTVAKQVMKPPKNEKNAPQESDRSVELENAAASDVVEDSPLSDEEKGQINHQVEKLDLLYKTKASPSSLQQAWGDLRHLLFDSDPATGLAPLWMRLGFLGTTLAGMMIGTKFIPQGMLAVALTKSASGASKAFLENYPYPISTIMMGTLIGGAYAAKDLHSTLYLEGISLHTAYSKRQLKLWMDPKDQDDSDDENDEIVTQGARSLQQVDPQTYYERFKFKAQAAKELLDTGCQKVVQAAKSISNKIGDKAALCLPQFVIDAYTKCDDGKPPVGKRITVLALTTLTAALASGMWPKQVVETTAMTLASGTWVPLIWGLGLIPRYVVSGATYGGAVLLKKAVASVPFVNNIRFNDLAFVTFLGLVKKECKKLIDG